MYTILIIDDEPIVKIALRSILPWEEHGFSICGTASNGLEAMPLIQKHQPDVIITDLKMPEMDGLELIRTLKEKGYPGAILVLSNYEDFDSVRSALLLGAADYLLKIKIQPDNLLACLNKTTEKLQKKAGERSALNVNTSSNKTGLLLSFFKERLHFQHFCRHIQRLIFLLWRKAVQSAMSLLKNTFQMKRFPYLGNFCVI